MKKIDLNKQLSLQERQLVYSNLEEAHSLAQEIGLFNVDDWRVDEILDALEEAREVFFVEETSKV